MLPHEDRSLSVWTVMAMGPQLDLPSIASSLEVLQKEFWAFTGRTDVKFESTSWLIRYRQVWVCSPLKIRVLTLNLVGRICVWWINSVLAVCW